jgi:hypothetical protein
MSDVGEGNRFAQSGEAAAREALERGERAGKQSARAAEQSYSATAEGMREMQIKLLDMAQANADAMFEFARQIARSSGPSDVVASWTAQSRKQFETFAAQANELTALGQRISGTSAAPIMQSAQQAFGRGT